MSEFRSLHTLPTHLILGGILLVVRFNTWCVILLQLMDLKSSGNSF
jgi:hypothetical protein